VLRESTAAGNARLPELLQRFLSDRQHVNQAAHTRQKDHRNDAIDPTQSDLFRMIGGKHRGGDIVAALSVRLKYDRVHGCYSA
jgi:hypothetical protein